MHKCSRDRLLRVSFISPLQNCRWKKILQSAPHHEPAFAELNSLRVRNGLHVLDQWSSQKRVTDVTACHIAAMTSSNTSNRSPKTQCLIVAARRITNKWTVREVTILQ